MPPTPRHDTWFRRAPRWKKAIARAVALGNRALDALPPLRACSRAQLFGTLEWTSLELSLPQQHAELAGFRLAFLSDLHAGSFVEERDLLRLFELVSARAPDVVLLGGDLVHTRERELAMYERTLGRLRPPQGVFAVPGNHERFRGLSLEHWRAGLERAGVQVLCNRGVRLARGRASLWLCGVDDLTEGRPDVDAALAGRDAGEPCVMLSHHPDLFPEIAERGVDLTLSGHTHGGQITPFGLVPVRHSAHGYDRGAFARDGSRLYVGRGIGAVILPLRIGAAPELPIITLRGH